MTKKLRKNSGHTLIEFLIYMSVVAVATVIFTSFTADVVKHAARATNTQEVVQSGRVLAARVSQELKTSQSITTPLPLTAATSITFVNSASQNVTISYDSVNMVVNYNGVPLSNSTVRVTDFSFTSISTDAISIHVRIEQKNPNAPQAQRYAFDFTSTVVPRIGLY